MCRYVEVSEEDVILSTVARARTARSLKHKMSKSCETVVQQ